VSLSTIAAGPARLSGLPAACVRTVSNGSDSFELSGLPCLQEDIDDPSAEGASLHRALSNPGQPPPEHGDPMAVLCSSAQLEEGGGLACFRKLNGPAGLKAHLRTVHGIV
jgi:hypothetical protein